MHSFEQRMTPEIRLKDPKQPREMRALFRFQFLVIRWGQVTVPVKPRPMVLGMETPKVWPRVRKMVFVKARKRADPKA